MKPIQRWFVPAGPRLVLAWTVSLSLHALLALLGGIALAKSARFGISSRETLSQASFTSAPTIECWLESDRPTETGTRMAPPSSSKPPPESIAVPVEEPPPPPEPPAKPTRTPPARSVEIPPVQALATEPAPAERTSTELASLPAPLPAPRPGFGPADPESVARSTLDRVALPEYEQNPPPRYPSIARNREWEGLVLLDVRVNEHGAVERLAIRRSSGHAVLDKAALRAVRRWHFYPATAAGIPVASQVEVPIRFRLD